MQGALDWPAVKGALDWSAMQGALDWSAVKGALDWSAVKGALDWSAMKERPGRTPHWTGLAFYKPQSWLDSAAGSSDARHLCARPFGRARVVHPGAGAIRLLGFGGTISPRLRRF
jgi:hypothetical protein